MGRGPGDDDRRLAKDRVILFENVGLRYGLGPEVLRDLNFAIDGHSFQFLTGPSGAGKPRCCAHASCRCGRRAA